MTTTSERPEWLVPGAEVVVYTMGGRGNAGFPDAQKTTVGRVTTQSFTVDGRPVRFKISTQEYHHAGSRGWGSYTLRAVPIDSDEARRELAKVIRQNLERAAWNACEKWARTRSLENRQSAIEALQAIPD